MMKTSIKNYFWHAWGILLFISLCLFIPFYSKMKYGVQSSNLIIDFAWAFFVIVCVPAIALYLRYYLLSRNYTVFYSYKCISFISNCKKRNINVGDISHIEIKMPIPMYFNGLRFFATDSFLYAVIYTKSKEKFVITSFLDRDLIDTIAFFKGKVDIKRKPRLLCWPPKNKVNITNN